MKNLIKIINLGTENCPVGKNGFSLWAVFAVERKFWKFWKFCRLQILAS